MFDLWYIQRDWLRGSYVLAKLPGLEAQIKIIPSLQYCTPRSYAKRCDQSEVTSPCLSLFKRASLEPSLFSLAVDCVDMLTILSLQTRTV